MNLDFRAFGPPTLETFAAVWLKRARHHMREALRAERGDWGADCVWSHVGEASAAVSVLYDINHDRAYGAVCSLRRVRRALDARSALRSGS